MVRQGGHVEIRGHHQAGSRRQLIDREVALVVHLVGRAAAGIEQRILGPLLAQVGSRHVDIVLVDCHGLVAMASGLPSGTLTICGS